MSVGGIISGGSGVPVKSAKEIKFEADFKTEIEALGLKTPIGKKIVASAIAEASYDLKAEFMCMALEV